MTGAAIDVDLRRFTADLLEACGGLAEWSSDEQGTAVVPEPIAALLQMPSDEFALSTQVTRGGLAVGLAGEFLDLADRVLDAAVPRMGAFHVPQRYLKGGNLQTALDRAYTWLNARVRLRGTRPTSVAYHNWWFFASLRSEDTWEATLSTTVNSEWLSEVELPELLRLPDLQPGPAQETSSSSVATYERAAAIIRERMKHAPSDFIGRMEARRERDRRRISDYYQALLREAAGSKRRSAPPPDPKELADKRRAVKLELERKLNELDERYTMQARLQPLVLVRTDIPALAVELSVRRKSAERKQVIYWNSLTKRFEPFFCSRCSRSIFAVAFTNDDVAPVCSTCG